MSQNQLSLSEISDLYRKKNPSESLEDVQEFYGYLVSASTIAAVVLSADPVTGISSFCTAVGVASSNINKLFGWFPDRFKFGKNDREAISFEKYKLAGVAHFFLLTWR